jgi:hypothetical protein
MLENFFKRMDYSTVLFLGILFLDFEFQTFFKTENTIYYLDCKLYNLQDGILRSSGFVIGKAES